MYIGIRGFVLVSVSDSYYSVLLSRKLYQHSINSWICTCKSGNSTDRMD